MHQFCQLLHQRDQSKSIGTLLLALIKSDNVESHRENSFIELELLAIKLL